MSGFGGVVGFMFAFFVVIGVFVASFYAYETQVIEQQKLTQASFEDTKSLFYDKFEISSAYILDRRLLLTLDNLNKDGIIFSKKDGFNCFSFFVNNKYVPVDNYFISVGGVVVNDYRLIEGKAKAYITIDGKYSQNSDLNIKVINCQGIESDFKLTANNLNWFDTDWQNKNSFNVKNIASEDIVDYQVKVDYNNSNFDFNNLNESDIRVVSSISNYLVLGLGFDSLSQNLIDYSNISNVVYLGNNTNSDNSDPSLNRNQGVINSLKFDGNSDTVNISSNPNLELSKSLTYSAWVRWNGGGSSINSIFINGKDSNSISIVNDGGVNTGKVRFELDIDGNIQTLYSNITLDNSWHFITATFDGLNMILYIDSKQVGNLSYFGNVVPSLSNNYVGSDSGSYYFDGDIDEVAIFNIPLNKDDILKLYEARLKYISLDFYVYNLDYSNKNLGLYVKIPFIFSGRNVTVDIFSNSLDDEVLASNIKNTFTYLVPRKIGYVLNDRISSTGGVNILSLADDNNIMVGSNSLSLDFLVSSNISTSNVNFNDSVYLTKLANVEGNANAVDMITPISWAGTEFDYRGFRSSSDRFCLIAPWGDANVSIYDAGVEGWNEIVNSSGICVTDDIGTNDVLTISSDIPILASYVPSQDSFVMFPAQNDNTKLYGSPSNTFYVAAGPLGSNVKFYKSDSSILNTQTLAANSSYSLGSNGGDGDAPGFVVWGDNNIGAIQQADGDGVESTVFVPKYEFSTFFGSSHTPSYLSVVSDVPDAGCLLYNSSDSLILNVSSGIGGNGIYKYNFGVGNDNDVLSGAWYLKCDKSVWPYYENTVFDDDETNLMGYLQMKQYIYPEPQVLIK